MELQEYREFRPTGFDAAGLGCDDRQDWGVAPVSRTRDSGPLDQSNYAVALASLEKIDPDGDDHEEHRFGHWGPGWFEIILVRPDSPCYADAVEIAGALADYPVLDESDLGERETEEEDLSWSSYGESDFLRALDDRWRGETYRDTGKIIDEIDVPLDAKGDILADLAYGARDAGHAYPEHHGDGVSFPTKEWAEAVTIDEILAAGLTVELDDGTLLDRRDAVLADPNQGTLFGREG